MIMRGADRDYTLGDSMEVHIFAYGLSGEMAQGNWTNFYLFIDHSRCLAFYEDELDAAHRKDIEVDPIRGTIPPSLSFLLISTFYSEQTFPFVLELSVEPSHSYSNTETRINRSVRCPHLVLRASSKSYKYHKL